MCCGLLDNLGKEGEELLGGGGGHSEGTRAGSRGAKQCLSSGVAAGKWPDSEWTAIIWRVPLTSG